MFFFLKKGTFDKFTLLPFSIHFFDDTLHFLASGLGVAPDQSNSFWTFPSTSTQLEEVPVSAVQPGALSAGPIRHLQLENAPPAPVRAEGSDRQFAQCCVDPRQGIVNYHEEGYHCILTSTKQFMNKNKYVTKEGVPMKKVWQQKYKELQKQKKKNSNQGGRW